MLHVLGIYIEHEVVVARCVVAFSNVATRDTISIQLLWLLQLCCFKRTLQNTMRSLFNFECESMAAQQDILTVDEIFSPVYIHLQLSFHAGYKYYLVCLLGTCLLWQILRFNIKVINTDIPILIKHKWDVFLYLFSYLLFNPLNIVTIYLDKIAIH